LALAKTGDLIQIITEKKKKMRTGDVAQVAECLLSKCKALSSNTSTTKK
jgi:F420-0:gamma-glutamyl ligase